MTIRALRVGTAACATAVLLLTASCASQDHQSAASAAALETLSDPLGPFTATIVTEGASYSITEVVEYTDIRNWSRSVVERDGSNINLPSVGSSQVMSDSTLQTIDGDGSAAVEPLVREGQESLPHVIFGFHGADATRDLEPEPLDDGAFRVRVMDNNVIEFDRYGAPRRMIFHDRDGSVLTTATVTHFKTLG